MSIWSTDLGYSETWPEWFVEYRRASDAEMNEKIAAMKRGELSKDDYKSWALKSAARHGLWVESLPQDRRIWLEAQEEEDRFTVVPANQNQQKVNLSELLNRKH
jgi:hypothetical protein